MPRRRPKAGLQTIRRQSSKAVLAWARVGCRAPLCNSEGSGLPCAAARRGSSTSSQSSVTSAAPPSLRVPAGSLSRSLGSHRVGATGLRREVRSGSHQVEFRSDPRGTISGLCPSLPLRISPMRRTSPERSNDFSPAVIVFPVSSFRSEKPHPGPSSCLLRCGARVLRRSDDAEVGATPCGAASRVDGDCRVLADRFAPADGSMWAFPRGELEGTALPSPLRRDHFGERGDCMPRLR
jgi:hypothetical protein